jgi:hypothetical protein
LQDNNEVKTAKFKKSLGMKFGPQKGNSMFDLVSFISSDVTAQQRAEV